MIDRLANTTMPFPTRCVRWRRWYALLRAKFSTWHASVFPDAAVGKDRPPRRLKIPEGVATLSASLPHMPHQVHCRTKQPRDLPELVEGLHVTIRAQETQGGMGRIYRLRDASRVLKVADIRTSWSKHEARNYEILRSKGVSCADVIAAAVKADHSILVLERLDFTMTAFIRAAGRIGASSKWVAGMVRGVLDALREAGLVYGDLSPDNIMFRSFGSSEYELALIDPQFVVPAEDFLKAMGSTRGNAFDTVYVALKIHAIGLMDPAVSKFTQSVCSGILGHVPREQRTRYWLVHEAPVGLCIAYDILRQQQKKP